MHGLLGATISVRRVERHYDKLRQDKWSKTQVTLLFRVGVREFEIYGWGFKVRFDPKFNIDVRLIQKSLSTLLLIILTWNLAITPSKCLASIPCWNHSEIWLCSWDRWDDTFVLRNGGNLLIMKPVMLGWPRQHRWHKGHPVSMLDIMSITLGKLSSLGPFQ